jgi:hypothetical protein
MNERQYVSTDWFSNEFGALNHSKITVKYSFGFGF